ncbi:hypothetical protein B0T21DRAFT_409666 [Apiosordaria backusii]|uniref:Zn(2)-C6 fungal-type domain-containing protein n=1 Tax=Apiosordaria backusii TaxID=314023 RepID=A0AA40EHP3_9PEZI|nr:hypothetical protein B0T21DRAFT_409666 [Apiosordaria backusii]
METETVRSPDGTLSPKNGDTQNALKLKARRIRKGTHSCWECKRRKIRCTFAAPSDAVCLGCHRRGTNCRSQELPEELSTPADRNRQMGDRIVRVEALIEQLVKKVGCDPSATQVLLKPEETTLIRKDDESTGSESSPRLGILDAPQEGLDLEDESLGVQRPSPIQCLAKLQPENGKHSRLCEALHSAYPSQQDLDLICEIGGIKAGMFALALSSADPAVGSGGNSDPKVYTHTNAYTQLPPNCENPRTIMRRLADTAIRLVTTNDEMLSSIESLHCILLEGLFQTNCGNLRRAWLAFRRAITVGQLMGIHRSYQHRPLKILDPSVPVTPQHLFHRLVCADGVVSLMLGLPQGTMESAMASRVHLQGDNTPVDKLERLQMGIAAQILERNESDPSFHDYASTKEIDLELQKIAQELPGRWWLPPSLVGAGNDVKEMLGRMWQLMRQVFHYNLLNQLHLPYMLRSNTLSLVPSNSAYSRDVCVTASRELLTRFVLFRAQDQVAFSCRAVDFYALMAAMTLLLAHLQGHCQPPDHNILAHQRLGDLGLVEGYLENMDTFNKLNADALSEKSAGLIRRLMAIEADAADGRRKYNTQGVHRSNSESVATPGRQNVLRVFIPYYGVVKIVAADEVISKEVVRSGSGGTAATVLRTNAPSSAPLIPQSSSFQQQTSQAPTQDQQAYSNTMQSQTNSQNLFTGGSEFTAPTLQQHSSNNLQPEHDSYLYPALTAGVDDWAFQGVDMAFFDSLMRSRDNTGTGLGPGYIRDPPTGYCDWETG